MLKKPFKPPGSKDGSENTSGLSKPFQKPLLKQTISAPSNLESAKATKKEESVDSKEQPISDSENLKENKEKTTPVIQNKPQGLLGLKSKPFKPLVSKLEVKSNTDTKTQMKPSSTFSTNPTAKNQPPQQEEKNSPEEFYKCFWSKDVKKKHKVLDDGIIVFTSSKVQIYNSDGEKIYDSYKSKLYCPNPDNGNQYIVGQYFVEQDDKISKDDFLSGRCFVKAKMTYEKDQTIAKKKIAPMKKNTQSEGPKPSDIVVPENSYLLTDPSNKQLFPVYIDVYLNNSMRIHQRLGVKFMFECISGLRGPDIGGCILADSMGLGKTLQTIALIWTLIRRNPHSGTSPLIRKVVVVAPVSLLGSWNKEVKKWLGDARLIPKIALGKRETVIRICKEFASSSAKMLLISYEQFRMHVETLSNACDLLIFDEGHRLKNMNIKTFRSFNSIKCNRRIILTGTPLQNSLDEFYSCVKFVNPNIFENEKQFKFVFSDPILAALKSDASADAVEKAAVRSKELTHIISRFVLRRKADILEKLLPPRSEYFIFLKLTPFQNMLYKKMIQARYNKSELDTGEGAFGLLTIMRKLLNHPQLIYTDVGNQTSQEFKQYFPQDYQLDDWEASFKFKFISDLLDQMRQIEIAQKSTERIIIVSYWTQTLDVLQIMIKQKNLKFVRLDGSVNAQKRQELIDRFQDPTNDIKVFLLCGSAGGTGLNLSAANRMVLMEANWNPSNDLQVMGRIWRDGQTKPVHIYRLVACGTMEEKVLQRQFLKEDLSQNVVDEKMIVKQYNNDKLKQLFEFKGDNQCTSFKEDENQLNQLKEFTPDYVDTMEKYITFVKRTIKGEKKDQEQESENVIDNAFDEGNIFLKPEAQNEDEADGEDSLDDKEINEEEEEKIREELTKDISESTAATGELSRIIEEDDKNVKECNESDDDFAIFNYAKKKDSDNEQPIKEIKNEDLIDNQIAAEKEEESQNKDNKEADMQVEEKAEDEDEVVVTKGRRGRRKATTTSDTNPAKNILKKLKK
ncbi:SNF2 family amine-terminal protein (macronuclear) [Tetrahymena thermophila SB210]|uniref:SNF2 family amine-terminal protein n=1 Tax=Tetrahymena thermophila (strain SB210) TaxID=312017 RepID=I7M3Y3_TETTS|nr:SNF2 family amine-terminal protein [Tetrahymena thermophila SB210]EAS04534.2 SNF2 family amine-terminal protein [Tetrahymena thermophila SB210]|eukprot:XP_001024779.2 SNF2 family amine-terminal protein [Tetrahymena thermophila SB210]